MARVELRKARPEDAPVLTNLLELYCYDLSQAFGLQLGADGRYGYPRLPLYWQEPDRRFAYLVLADGQLAGFALATRGSPATEDPSHLDVAEFFIVRALRRSGIGERAAHALWDQMPGHWVVRAARRNAPAVDFWRGVIGRYARAAEAERELHGAHWTVFQFDATQRAGGAGREL